MHALTLAYIKEITMTVSTQSFSRCRTRMIRNLLSEKASQTLISITCCVHGQTEAAYFISGYCICATYLWTAIHPIYCTCSFLKYTFNMCLNFELFVLEESNPPVLNLPQNWCTPTQLHCLEVPIEHSQLVSPIFGV